MSASSLPRLVMHPLPFGSEVEPRTNRLRTQPSKHFCNRPDFLSTTLSQCNSVVGCRLDVQELSMQRRKWRPKIYDVIEKEIPPTPCTSGETSKKKPKEKRRRGLFHVWTNIRLIIIFFFNLFNSSFLLLSCWLPVGRARTLHATKRDQEEDCKDQGLTEKIGTNSRNLRMLTRNVSR